jgi:hypothetical protein
VTRSSFATLLCFAFVACAEGTGPRVPTFAGSITTRTFAPVADHVYGNILVAKGATCDRQLIFWIDSRTTRLLRRDGLAISVDSLNVGRSVTVEYSGAGALTCPGQSGAETVILEP